MSDLELDNFYFEDSYIEQEMKAFDLNALTNGKHLRSRLIFLTSSIFSMPIAEVTKLARVVELVHNATLTHDDVIDNSHTRRGTPSVPALINNKKSVLLGDYMLARALHELSDFQNPKLTQELTLTLKELVEGEWIQYENTNPYKITTDLYERLALKKTGSLFRWAFIAPLAASRNEDQSLYRLLSDFGKELGIIFQMTDDLIDFNVESKKSYGLDFKNNNINFVLHFVGQKYPELETKFLREDDINELNHEQLKVIDEAKVMACAVVNSKINQCREILEVLEEKIGAKSTSSLAEFSKILDLIATRVF